MPGATEVARDVFFVEGEAVNWVLLREGTDLTLVDTGYPGDVDALERSIRDLGRRPEDVRAVLVTHAHVDHVGGLRHLHERYGTPVLMDPRELPNARRDVLEQATTLDVVRNVHRPGVLAWSLRIARKGATKDVAFPHARGFPAPGPLDLPGGPVPVPTPGHTSGHSAYHLPEAGLVITGDALVSGHQVLPVAGPQLLPCMFRHGDDVAALDALEPLDAGGFLPGHGPAWTGDLGEAVATARQRASDRTW